jgi:hypothetical protein
MRFTSIMAVHLGALVMIVIVVTVMFLVMIMVAIVVTCHKMLLIGCGIVVALIAVGGVHMCGAVGVGMGFSLGNGTAAGSAKHANYGKKKKQLFHGYSV